MAGIDDRAPRIVTIAERPDLAPLVAGWLWNAFWRGYGHTLAYVHDLVAGAHARHGPPQCFVLLLGDEPAGTASLLPADLDERPDLTPWLGGVFVRPASRGQGHVGLLIEAVEAAARDAGTGTLWLYTRTAERVYARAGWTLVEHFPYRGSQAALMQRTLRPA